MYHLSFAACVLVPGDVLGGVRGDVSTTCGLSSTHLRDGLRVRVEVDAGDGAMDKFIRRPGAVKFCLYHALLPAFTRFGLWASSMEASCTSETF